MRSECVYVQAYASYGAVDYFVLVAVRYSHCQTWFRVNCMCVCVTMRIVCRIDLSILYVFGIPPPPLSNRLFLFQSHFIVIMIVDSISVYVLPLLPIQV